MWDLQGGILCFGGAADTRILWLHPTNVSRSVRLGGFLTSEQFVFAVKRFVSDPSTASAVRMLTVPGKGCSDRMKELSNWFGSLDESDRNALKDCIQFGIDAALFNLFCVFDDVDTIEEGEQETTFRLIAVRGSEEVILNGPRGEMLHDIYRRLAAV